MTPSRHPEGSRPNLAFLDDHRAPDVDDMLDRVHDDVHAARDLPGMTDGERRRQPGKDAGEENQEPDDWNGA